MNRRSFVAALALGSAGAASDRPFPAEKAAGASVSITVHPEISVAAVPQFCGV